MSTSPHASFLDVVEFGETHESESFRQYAGHLLKVTSWRGYQRADLSRLDADLGVFLELAPKYDPRNATLLRDLPWKKATYQQYRKCGRLLIEHATGAFAARQERKAIADDSWAVLARRAEALAHAALISSARLSGLVRITDLSREAGFQSTDLTVARVVSLKALTRSPDAWESAKRGVKLLDHLRMFPTILDLLPAHPIGSIGAPWRRPFRIPEALETELDAWLEIATTLYPENTSSEHLREALAEPHSPGAAGIYQAALRNYIDTLGAVRDLGEVTRLAEIFADRDIISVLLRWIENRETPSGLEPATMWQYLDRIRLTLERNGRPQNAHHVATVLATHPVLRQGKGARERMSPKSRAWCLALLNSPNNVEVFETQHLRYALRAQAALAAARAEGLDLFELAIDPQKMGHLPPKRRGRAKKLIKEACRFGTCAAFAAIELEGAPLRRENALALTRSGPNQTFFDHATDSDPHYRIVIPNEMLKNGKSLTARGEELPPIVIRKRGSGDRGVDILRFYFERIRPLFPRSTSTAVVFPSVSADQPHLVEATFSNWLLACSIDIGFGLTAHNFRHGLCSIQINDDPRCIEELAVFLGDQPGTLRKYYAFLKRDDVLNRMQDSVAERRARYRSGRDPARKRAA